MRNNLIDAYVAGHASQTAALAYLSDAMERKIVHSRLGEWRNGKRPIPADVRRHMLHEVLPHVLRPWLGKHSPDLAYDLSEQVIDLCAPEQTV